MMYNSCHKKGFWKKGKESFLLLLQIFQKKVFEFAYEVTVWNSSVMSKHSALTQASRIFGVSLNTCQEEWNRKDNTWTDICNCSKSSVQYIPFWCVWLFIIHMKVVKVAADTVGKLFVSSVCVILTLLHLSDNALLLVWAHCNKSSTIYLRVFVKLQLDTKIPAAHISWCCYSYVSNFSSIFTGY